MRVLRALLVAVIGLVAPAVAGAAGVPHAVSGPRGGPAAPDVTVSHGLSLFGDLKYGPDFTHFDYVNPDAPRGGEVRRHAIGTFDSLNPYILKGVAAAGLGGVFETLLASAADEPASAYGLIAETVEMPGDRSWVTFTLRPEARFHDGSPITADDVVFSFDTIKTKGHPFFRAYFANVAKAEKLGPRRVRFVFSGDNNRELPFIVGNDLPILSKKWFEGRAFEETTLDPPMGSGPYRVADVDPGRSITYERVRDYWGADLPVNRGRNNYDLIRYDYYRDSTVALEAFKAGSYDFRQENTAKMWATGYDFPALRQGLVKKEEIPNQLPTGMQGFVFNTRRDIFADRRVRWALNHAFDFEWTNRNLFYGAYTRTESYFSNSELAAEGLPGEAELEILEPFRGKVPEEVFTREYEPPEADGSGNNRRNLREALRLLREAGWVVRDGRLVDEKTGAPMEFEILLVNPLFERISAPFVKNLQRLGIRARIRTVDTAQYQNRIDNFDFDMTVAVWGESLSPGNEQRNSWTCAAARTPGSRNYAGICDPVVDRLVEQVISAPDRDALVARTRALDRVLLWGHYVIPQWHISVFRVAYWDKFDRPKETPKYALGFNTWWVDPVKAARIRERQGAVTN